MNTREWLDREIREEIVEILLCDIRGLRGASTVIFLMVNKARHRQGKKRRVDSKKESGSEPYMQNRGNENKKKKKKTNGALNSDL